MAIPVTDADDVRQVIATIDDLLAVLPASLGTKAAASSLSVTIANNDTILGYLDGIETGLSTLNTSIGTMSAKLPSALGQQTKANSMGVTLASDEDLLSRLGALTETAPGTDTASSGLNGRLQRIAQRITSLIGLFPASIGQKAKSAAFPVVLSSDEDLYSLIGATNETSAAADNSTSGLNGLIKRLNARITSLIALFPASLGQKTSANSMSVVLASDYSVASNQQPRLLFMTPSVDATALAIGDVMAATEPLTGIAKGTDIPGVLDFLRIVDASDTKAALTIYVFNNNRTLGTENSPPSLTDSDAIYLVGVINVSVGDWVDFGGGSVATLTGLGIYFQPDVGTSNLYFGIVTNTAVTLGSTSAYTLFWGVR